MNKNEINKNNDIDTENITVTPETFAVKESMDIPEIDSEELAVAEKEASQSTDVYTHKFKKTATYNNLLIPEMSFDWASLTGQDSLNIEGELQAMGKMVISPAFSGEYMIRMAARASSPKVGSDFFANLSLFDYNKIRSAARSFLLVAE